MSSSPDRSPLRPVTLISGHRGLAERLLKTFHEAGHRLSVLVRRQEAAGEVKALYPDALVHTGDIANRKAAGEWVRRSVEKFGRIDCLINNAAIQGPGGRLHELDIDEVAATVEVDLLAPLFLIQQVLPVFLKERSGVVLNLAGGGANAPRPFFIPYGIAKCAVVRLTETLAHEYPDLRFYAISPGAMATPMMQTLAAMDPAKIGKEQADAVRRVQSGGDDPAKAAQLALWLFNERPSRLNGTVISAIWDDYRKAPEYPKEVGWWRLRRVDEVCIKNLKSALSDAE